jgi:GNAT superfamily N-acetyltransferase
VTDPGSTAGLTTRPVGPEELRDLASLFETERNMRRCWCMAFCETRTQFALGWVTGANERRFGALAAAGPVPMGILASRDGVAVGWGACGPRARYVAATSARNVTMRSRRREEDATVWLVPCLFVRAGHRGQGVTHALVRSAVALARREGAAAIEGWPLAASQERSGDAFLGRQQVFADVGFQTVDRPSPERVIMRLELVPTR